MTPYIVLAAELLTAGWLIFFTLIVLDLWRSGRKVAEPRLDDIGARLQGAARLAIVFGVPALALAETAYMLGLFG